jgi:hypothetical protein
MSFNLLGKYFGHERHVGPGDTVTIEYIDYKGERISYSEEIKKEFTITDAGIFEFENEFGLKCGVGGYFGEKS